MACAFFTNFINGLPGAPAVSSVAIAMAVAAVGLLAVYGADVAASMSGGGFIPLDERARGLGLGVPSLILPFAAYAVGRRSGSVLLGALITAAGALVMVGGAAVLAAPSERDPFFAAAPLLAAGAAQAALGAFAVLRARR